ncbi:MAG: SufS family cysteine desulfurase [Bdellovibrionota bacterium]
MHNPKNSLQNSVNGVLADIRGQFPALNQKIRDKNLIYLDSAATTLKPKCVIDRMTKFYSYETANVHRGAHYLADAATSEFENARETIRNFINAASIEEVIFTGGTTAGINLVAASYGHFLNEGDEIVLTELEHHSNIVAWQVLAEQKKCVLKYIAVLPNGEIDLNSVDKKINAKTKVVAFSACSNILGSFTPIQEIVTKAKSVGAVTLLDAAQFVSQKKVDVQKLDVDFLVFSAHKLFGPFGFGVLYGRKDLLNKMPVYQTGGSMIDRVDYQKSTFNHLPFKFEAGTPHIAGAIGTSAALDFLNQFNITELFSHEQNLMKMLVDELRSIREVEIFGTSENKAAIVSFTMQGMHHSDIGQILDQQGVAVRVGHHCTQPLLKKFNLTGTVRASISIYNNENDISRFIESVKKAKGMLL